MNPSELPKDHEAKTPDKGVEPNIIQPEKQVGDLVKKAHEGIVTRVTNSETSDVFFSNIEWWLQHELPQLNNAAGSDPSAIGKLKTVTREFITAFPRLNTIGITEARSAIKYIGFLVSSLELHSQDVGNAAGSALSEIEGAEKLLTGLAAIAKHPPRDSLYTFALWNHSPTITFSGDPQETLFVDVVRQSTNELFNCGNCIRQIRHAHDADDLRSLKEADGHIDATRQQFIRFLRTDDNGRPALTAEFFANIMRQYNCKWVLAGQEWGGPTAANCAPYISIDFLLGAADSEYNQHTLERFRYLTDEDQMMLDCDMKSMSLAEGLHRKIGKDQSEFLSAGNDEIASLLVANRDVYEFTVAFNQLAEKFSQLSGLHYGLINKFFKSESEADQEKTVAVDNTRGTSGMSFPDVWKIRQMRRTSPVLTKFQSALHSLTK